MMFRYHQYTQYREHGKSWRPLWERSIDFKGFVIQMTVRTFFAINGNALRHEEAAASPDPCRLRE